MRQENLSEQVAGDQAQPPRGRVRRLAKAATRRWYVSVSAAVMAAGVGVTLVPHAMSEAATSFNLMVKEENINGLPMASFVLAYDTPTGPTSSCYNMQQNVSVGTWVSTGFLLSPNTQYEILGYTQQNCQQGEGSATSPSNSYFTIPTTYNLTSYWYDP